MTRSQDPFFGAGARTDASSYPQNKAQPVDGAFQVADWKGRIAAEAGMIAHPEIRKNFHETLRDLVGPEFTADEFTTLERRTLNAVTLEDLATLKGIYVGVPVDLNPAQKITIDRMMNGLGDDPLGQRARATYQGAVKNGKIRVR